MEWCKFAASKLETTQAIWIAAELLTLAKESGRGSLLGEWCWVWVDGSRSMESQWPKYRQELSHFNSYIPLFHPSTIMGYQTWETWPFCQRLHPPSYQHIPTVPWKPPEELEGLLRDPRDFTRIISLLGSRHQPDLILKLGFGENSWIFFRSPLRLEGVATSKDWYDLVSSFLNFDVFFVTPSWLGNCSKTWTGVWGPASLGVAKVVKGPGMVGWITWARGKSWKIWDSLDLAARKMPFCWFPTKQRSELKTCPCDTMLSGIGASEVITYSAAMNSLSKTGDWAMATGLLRQLDAELSMNGKDMMTLRETAWKWRMIQGTLFSRHWGVGDFHNVFFHFGC